VFDCVVAFRWAVLWQLLTEKVPFEGKFTQTHQLVEAVTRGERPAIPNNTPKKLRELIEQCWHQNPEKRPTFQQILDSKVHSESFYRFRLMHCYKLLTIASFMILWKIKDFR
jgi:hypothetical protein